MEEPQTTPVQPSVTPKEFPWKKLSIALIAFILVAGGAGTVLAWRTTYLDNYLPAGVKEFFGRGEERGEPTPEEVEEETKDWKTYKNEAYGYEIKYPSTWFYSGSKGAPAESAAQIVFDANQEDLTNPALEAHAIVITVAEREILDPLLDCELYEEEEKCERKSITIGGVKGEQVDFLEFDLLQSAVAKSETAFSPSRVYYFNLQKKAEYREIYDLMLSTFEFLPEEDPTEDWKIYENRELGYELKYPSNWAYAICESGNAPEEGVLIDTVLLWFGPKTMSLGCGPGSEGAIIVVVNVGKEVPESLYGDIMNALKESKIKFEHKAITLGGLQGEQLICSQQGWIYSGVVRPQSHPYGTKTYTRIHGIDLHELKYREIYDLMLSTFKFL